MSSSLLNLVDNLSDGLDNNKCINCKSFLDYMMFKHDELIFRGFECNKNYNKNFNKELIKVFINMYEFCKFILLLRKVVYPYKCIDSWERFND